MTPGFRPRYRKTSVFTQSTYPSWTQVRQLWQMEVRVVDLERLVILPDRYTGHKGFTPNDACFFIFSDGSPHFIARFPFAPLQDRVRSEGPSLSGSEDGRGRLWSREFRAELGELGHASVVNSVAFNPAQAETLATASDDHSIKVACFNATWALERGGRGQIWRSKRAVTLMREKAELMGTEFPTQQHFLPSKDQRLYTWQLPDNSPS